MEKNNLSIEQSQKLVVVEDVVDLGKMLRTLWAKRWLLLGITVVSGVVAATVAIRMPNIYRAEILLSPVSETGEKGRSSMLSQFGGLASLAGLSIGGNGSVEENLAVLNSRAFIWTFIQENNLLPILFEKKWDIQSQKWKSQDKEKQPTLWDAYRLLTKEGVLLIEQEKKSDLIKIAFEWTDPVVASKWTNNIVERLNEYLRQQAIERGRNNLQYLSNELSKTSEQELRQALFDLISQEQKKIMLASTQKEYAFKVLDAAQVPDKKIKPKRAIIVILASLIGLLIGSVWVLIRANKAAYER